MKVIALPCGPLMANMYLVCSDDFNEAIVIDPIDVLLLRKTLLGTSLTVVGIFCTHAHFDHTASLQEIRTLTNAPSFIHAEDQPLLHDAYANVSAMIASPTDLGICDRLLKDSETVTVGSFSVKVIHTPGHTPGSVCLLFDDYLFTGDTVFANGIGRTDLFGGDSCAMRSSLERILAFNTDLHLYPGHGNSTRFMQTKRYLDLIFHDLYQ